MATFGEALSGARVHQANSTGRTALRVAPAAATTKLATRPAAPAKKAAAPKPAAKPAAKPAVGTVKLQAS